MQQFARRQPYEPENDPPKPPTQFEASDESVAQWMDQLCAVQQQVASLTEEVAAVKGENQRLRAQIAAWVANQEAYLSGKPATPAADVTSPEIVAEVEPSAETETEPIAEPEPLTESEPIVAQPIAEIGASDVSHIDEESFIEIARGTEVPIETPSIKAEPTDEEIQRMLAEVASGATDAKQEPTPEPVIEQPVSIAEIETEPGVPFLHIQEDAPEEATVLSFEIDRAAVKRVPANLAIAALAVPVRLEGDSVVCKAVAPFDFASLDLIADAIASKVVPEPAPIEEVVAALRIAYNDESYSDEREEVWAVSGAPGKKKGLFRRSA